MTNYALAFATNCLPTRPRSHQLNWNDAPQREGLGAKAILPGPLAARTWLPGQRSLIWLGAVHRFAATDPVHPASQAEGLLHSALEIPAKMQAPILPFVEERKYNDLGSAFVNEAIEKVIADRFPIDVPSITLRRRDTQRIQRWVASQRYERGAAGIEQTHGDMRITENVSDIPHGVHQALMSAVRHPNLITHVQPESQQAIRVRPSFCSAAPLHTPYRGYEARHRSVALPPPDRRCA